MIRIEINTGNAAFEPYAGHEVARILRDAAGRLERENIPSRYRGEVFKLYDVNGNRVGQVSVHKDTD